VSSWGETKRIPSSAATRFAVSVATARLRAVGAGAQRAAPRSSERPASSQPIVPFSSATTGLGSLMRRSDSAPM